ncbi:hypothetical protein MVEN_01915300 [Mycena venus]|uniref:Uncharacterized protein n=1 Tax=Mycena venus TaxID=2733690 RepID=A0A8H6XGA9_9AGAR|nr:hypothetical protein MVEN_01915300 [Mycena venus]
MSMAKFLARFSSPEEAFQQCSLGSAFDRGLPTEEDLKDPSNLSSVDFCRSLLEADGPLFFEHHEAPLNAQQAHKQGWVMLDDDQDDSMGSFIRADFPSPFHRSRLSFLLLGRQTLPPAVNEMTLIKFVCKVFASFSRSAPAETPTARQRIRIEALDS